MRYLSNDAEESESECEPVASRSGWPIAMGFTMMLWSIVHELPSSQMLHSSPCVVGVK